jgi:hypothetical protein
MLMPRLFGQERRPWRCCPGMAAAAPGSSQARSSPQPLVSGLSIFTKINLSKTFGPLLRT